MLLTITTKGHNTILTLTRDGAPVEVWATPTHRVGLESWIDKTIIHAATLAGGSLDISDRRVPPAGKTSR